MNRNNFDITEGELRITDNGFDDGGILLGWDIGGCSKMALDKEQIPQLIALLDQVRTMEN